MGQLILFGWIKKPGLVYNLYIDNLIVQELLKQFQQVKNHAMKIKIKNQMNLTLNERLVYMMLCNVCGTKDYKTVSRSFLCDRCNIKDQQTISNITTKLHKIGLISKNTVLKPNNTKVTMYKVVNYDEDFLLFDNSLLFTDMSNGAKSIATMLAPLRYKGQNYIDMSIRAISEKFGVSRNTFKKYLHELVENDIVEIIDGRIYLNTDYFPLFVYKTKNAKDYEKCLKDMPKNSRAYKKFINMYKNNYEGIYNVEAALFSILTEN